MRKIQCYECGKRYDFDVDDFCPRCGAFTIPPHSTRVGADGAIVRVEGINERNHKNSFLHEELHDENRERKGSFLEGAASAFQKASQGSVRLSNRQPGKKSSGSSTLFEVADLLNDLLFDK